MHLAHVYPYCYQLLTRNFTISYWHLVFSSRYVLAPRTQEHFIHLEHGAPDPCRIRGQTRMRIGAAIVPPHVAEA